MRVAAWTRPAIHLLSSSQGPAASSSPTHHLHRLLRQFRSPSSWSWQQTASSITRSSPLHHVPARSCRSPGSGRNRPATPTTEQRHLYVVLQDFHANGFEIHKLGMGDDDDSGSATGTTLPPRRLPEPPAARVGIGRGMDFAALGSSIVATGGCHHQGTYRGVTVVYDTKTADLAESDLLPHGLHSGCDLAVAIGKNRLYAFESSSDNFRCPACEVCFPGGLHCLRATDDAAGDDERWNWRPLPNSPGFSWSWNNSWPPELPFYAQSITAHAVHPRGRTLFVSAGGWRVDVGTFTYSAATGKWKRRGDWELPFRGRGHYDADLDAWVGFHKLKDERGESLDDIREERTDGHLCACRVTSAAGAGRRPPEWKVSKETLLREIPPGWTRLEARLVYMRDRGEYCLVEHLGVDDRTYLLRLTVFRAKYGEDGELTTTAHGLARSYEVPGLDDFTQAFWM